MEHLPENVQGEGGQLPQVFQVPGPHGQPFYSVGDGYYYRVDSAYRDGLYRLRCPFARRQGCVGSATLEINDQRTNLRALQEHICEPNLQFGEVCSLKARLNERAASSITIPLRQIFYEDCRNVPLEAASQIAFTTVESTMRRARTAAVPPIPPTLTELGRVLAGEALHQFTHLPDGSRFFYEVIGDGDVTSLLFIATPLLDFLYRCEMVHIDGTFRTLPSVPANRQLLTIMGSDDNHGFRVIFAVMASKSEAAYHLVFEWVKRTCPAFHPPTIMSDYETAEREAVRRSFPESRHVGCWFHYCQALYRKVVSLWLLGQYRLHGPLHEVIKMTMGLPCAPPARIEEGVEACVSRAEEANIQQILQPFFSYFQRYWMLQVGPVSFSVAGQPRRTNALQEAWHRSLHRLVPTHPNVWVFTVGLVQMAHASVLDNLRLHERGIQLEMSSSRRRWIQQDQQIQRAQVDLQLVDAMVQALGFNDGPDEDLAPLEQDEVILPHAVEALPPRGRGRGGRARNQRRGPVRGRAPRRGGHQNRGVVLDLLQPELHPIQPVNVELEAAQQADAEHAVQPEDEEHVAVDVPQPELPPIQPDIVEHAPGLQPNEEEVTHENRCAVCLLRMRSVIAVPCGHFSYCGPCGREMEARGERCAVCRMPVQLYMTVFQV